MCIFGSGNVLIHFLKRDDFLLANGIDKCWLAWPTSTTKHDGKFDAFFVSYADEAIEPENKVKEKRRNQLVTIINVKPALVLEEPDGDSY